MADRLSAHGLRVDLPDGWDGRIYRRQNEVDGTDRRALHAANFPLPANRGDYGGGVTERMERDGVFVTLVEFHTDNADDGLFANRGLPTVTPRAFAPDAMPRAVAGQAGAQFFFSKGGRAFCLFVVIGSYADRERLVPIANEILDTLEID